MYYLLSYWVVHGKWCYMLKITFNCCISFFWFIREFWKKQHFLEYELSHLCVVLRTLLSDIFHLNVSWGTCQCRNTCPAYTGTNLAGPFHKNLCRLLHWFQQLSVVVVRLYTQVCMCRHWECYICFLQEVEGKHCLGKKPELIPKQTEELEAVLSRQNWQVPPVWNLKGSTYTSQL